MKSSITDFQFCCDFNCLANCRSCNHQFYLKIYFCVCVWRPLSGFEIRFFEALSIRNQSDLLHLPIKLIIRMNVFDKFGLHILMFSG